MRKNDIAGHRFGRRVVLGPAGMQGIRRLWQWRCDCGSEGVATPQTLRMTVGCQWCGHKGERPYRRKRPFEVNYNSLVQRARHPVHISYEEFVAFTSEQSCHYCGEPIPWMEYRVRNGGGSGSFLDRKDSARPYEIGNLVVCCVRCNKAKNTHFSYDEWKQIGDVIRSWRALAMLQLEIEAERKGHER
jgi:hypothetical protein